MLRGIFNFRFKSSLKESFSSFTLSSSRTGCHFFPTAGKSNQKEPPLKDKKLKTESVRLKISKLLPLVVKQGNFLNTDFFSFLTLFLLRRFKALRSSGLSDGFSFALFGANTKYFNISSWSLAQYGRNISSPGQTTKEWRPGCERTKENRPR